jgi:hypothetical protein
MHAIMLLLLPLLLPHYHVSRNSNACTIRLLAIVCFPSPCFLPFFACSHIRSNKSNACNPGLPTTPCSSLAGNDLNDAPASSLSGSFYPAEWGNLQQIRGSWSKNRMAVYDQDTVGHMVGSHEWDPSRTNRALVFQYSYYRGTSAMIWSVEWQNLQKGGAYDRYLS